MQQFNFDSIANEDDTEDLNVLSNDILFKEMSLLFPNVNSILIPKKVAYALQKYVPKKSLKTIDSDPSVAVEKCLVFLSNLASTIYTDEKWKALYSPLLHEQTKDKDNTYLYKKIVEVLIKGTNNGPILEVDTRYYDGSSMKYKLADPYLKVGLTEYILKTPKIIQVRNKLYYKQLSKALNNPIASNLIQIYPKLDLPTSEELLEIGKRLVKDGYTTNKSKKLTIRNKHQNHYWADHKKRSFVEDNIKLFEYLTERGFMIPIEGDEKSGGRVVDSFTLMPSWIRKQITIDGMPLHEADFVALHPNIAMTLYNGKGEYLNHQKIADVIGEDLKTVKVEHLSFFNKKIGQMKKSSLYEYYQVNEPDALRNIEEDKRKHGYKITAYKFFKTEVEIMTKAIMELNAEGIYVVYVYDALLCEEKDFARVREIMNNVALQCKIKTRIKEINPKVQCEKYHLEDEVNLYKILPIFGLSVKKSMVGIYDLNASNVKIKEFVSYISEQWKPQS